MPNPYSDPSSPATDVGNGFGTGVGPGVAAGFGTRARQFTEPLREMGAFALLGANCVLLLLGFSGLFLVIDRWAGDFGLRCAAVFSTFVGPLALGLPMAAVLLATHVAPMVRRSKVVLLVALVEYGVSALFGAVTFLGAFASDLTSVRATLEGLLGRSVWLGLLILGCIVVVRVWMGLFPAARPRPVAYPAAYAQPAYGRPYPGQPMYPHATYQSGSAAPTYPASDEPTSENGWPLVPAPPTPAPLLVESEPTVRIAPATLELGGHGAQSGATPTQSPPARPAESPTQQIARPASDNGA